MTDDLRGWLRYQITAHRSTEAAERFVNDAMQHINAYANALTEQRVAAAVQAERDRAVEILHETGWLGRSEQRIAHPELFDRPAPEGAAPTADLARRRCSPPSQPGISEKQDSLRGVGVEQPTQDAGQPGCGSNSEIAETPSPKAIAERAFQALDNFEIDVNRTAPQAVWDALRHLANLSPPSQEDTQPGCGWVLVPQEPTEEMIIAAAFAGPDRCEPDGVAEAIWPAMIAAAPEPPNVTGGPGSASNTESSPTLSELLAAHSPEMNHGEAWPDAPTQTVAAPGPTAGDVERACRLAALIVGEWHDDGGAVTDPEFDQLERRIHVVIGPELAKARASARAELLAQIREPKVVATVTRAFGDVICSQFEVERIGDGDKQRVHFTLRGKALDFSAATDAAMRALYDKLTEAK